MSDYKIEFEKIPWIAGTAGLRFKELIFDNKKLRLVEFSDGLDEKDWCTKGHVGVALEGTASVVFANGKQVTVHKNDIINIPQGNENKHKTIISRGEKALVLFFEVRC